MRNIPKITTSILSAAILLALLTACGGGGSGMVRNSPAPLTPPSTPPPPPPPATSAGPCPMPISADCVISEAATMLDGRTSSNALVLRLPPGQELRLGGNSSPYWDEERQGTYTFASGTLIESGVLSIIYGRAPNTLVSNVDIRPQGGLWVQGKVIGQIQNQGQLAVSGIVDGNVDNQGETQLLGVVTGHLINSGRLEVTGATYGDQPVIGGDFSQTGSGVLTFELAPERWDSPTPLQVAGAANLAGTLQFVEYSDGWGSDYPLPALGAHSILHADGGVFGTFDNWTSLGLFITGVLRYEPNEVLFDLTSISLQAGATSHGLGSALTLASATNVDRAITAAVGFAGPATPTEQAFLSSAGKLLWMGDAAQATRALDSLSGAIHADALQSTGDGAATRMLIASHLAAIAPGHALGAWLGDNGSGAIAGVDQWLSPHLLAGVHARQLDATDMASANATDLGGGAYLRWIGNNGWYAGLDAGIAHRTLTAGRRIDFGASGQWLARSRRSMDAVSASIEAGKRLPMLGGSLTPFLGAGFSSVQASAASEQGSSGFELQLADTHLRGSRASAGMRFARDWRWGDTRWLQVNAASGIDYSHWNGHQRAAFLGVPDGWFDLPASSAGRQRWASLGLQGGWGHGWTWNAARSTGRAFGSDRAWQLALRRDW